MVKSQFDPAVMKARFWELTSQKEVLEAELAPLKEKRDTIRDALRGPTAKYREAKAAVIAVERPRMAEIMSEMALIARALGQKIGERPE